MQIALAHIGPSWLVSLFLLEERRYLDEEHTFVSAHAALSYVQHWAAQGATIRERSQAMYVALQAEAAAGAALVQAVGE